MGRLANHPRHAANHEAGGSDEPRKTVFAHWTGDLPSSAGNGLTKKVPRHNNGAELVFKVSALDARIEDVSADDVSFTVEHSTGSGGFSGSPLGTVTILAGDYEPASPAAASGTVRSGDKLRLVFDSVASDVQTEFDVQLLGGT